MSVYDKFDAATLEKLGVTKDDKYYVYVYSDPDTKKPFYVGKGTGNRCFNHLTQEGTGEKIDKIKNILDAGKRPIIEILARNVDENTAFKIEAAAIDLIGISNLTNIQKGHHSSDVGRIDVDDLISRTKNEEISDITDDVIMIRINELYFPGMTDLELYETTRGVWRVSKANADKTKYALAVYEGLVKEVYEIAAWVPAGSTLRSFRQEDKIEGDLLKRWEFVGKVAPEEVRKKYLGKIVSSLLKSRNPIQYYLGGMKTEEKD